MPQQASRTPKMLPVGAPGGQTDCKRHHGCLQEGGAAGEGNDGGDGPAAASVAGAAGKSRSSRRGSLSGKQAEAAVQIALLKDYSDDDDED